jgi:hypothetical protein
MKKTLMIAVEQEVYEAANNWAKEGAGAKCLEEHLMYNIILAALLDKVKNSPSRDEIVNDLMLRVDMDVGRKTIIEYLQEQYQRVSTKPPEQQSWQ